MFSFSDAELTYLFFLFFLSFRTFWNSAKAGDCVLDICCGSGDLAFLLSQKVGSNGKVARRKAQVGFFV